MEKLAAKAGSSPGFSHSPQTQLKAQNSRIEQLFQKVAQQQRHLEKQYLKIQNLQSQVPDVCPMWGGSWTCGSGCEVGQVGQPEPARPDAPFPSLPRWAFWPPCTLATA